MLRSNYLIFESTSMHKHGP